MTDKDKEIKQLKERIAQREKLLNAALDKIERYEEKNRIRAEEDRAAAARKVWDKIQKGQLHYVEV